MENKSLALGAIGALLIGGISLGAGVSLGQHSPNETAPAAQQVTETLPTLSGWRADAWETYTVGIEDMTDTREGFDKTYLGTYSTRPANRLDTVVLESAHHPGVFHVFAIQQAKSFDVTKSL